MRIIRLVLFVLLGCQPATDASGAKELLERALAGAKQQQNFEPVFEHVSWEDAFGDLSAKDRVDNRFMNATELEFGTRLLFADPVANLVRLAGDKEALEKATEYETSIRTFERHLLEAEYKLGKVESKGDIARVLFKRVTRQGKEFEGEIYLKLTARGWKIASLGWLGIY